MFKKLTDHHSSSFAQGTCELYESHFYLLYNPPPVQLSTSGELISAHEHGLDGDALLKSCFLFDEQDREVPLQDVSEAVQRALSYDTLVSKPHDTCIPTLSDLSCLRCSLKPPSRDFERSTSLEASSFCRNSQTFIVPRQSRGFT